MTCGGYENAPIICSITEPKQHHAQLSTKSAAQIY